MLATGWWTTDHVLGLSNVVLAAAALGAIWFSYRVAAATRETVKAALKQVTLGEKQLEKEREALLTSVRPILVDVEQIDPEHAVGLYDDEQGLTFWTRSRNVGPGAAFIHEGSFFSHSGNLIDRKFNRHVVPQGGTFDATVIAEALRSRIQDAPEADLRISFIVQYSDVGGGQRTETVIEFAKTPNVNALSFLVARVELRACDEKWIPGDSIVRTGNP